MLCAGNISVILSCIRCLAACTCCSLGCLILLVALFFQRLVGDQNMRGFASQIVTATFIEKEEIHSKS